MVARYLEHFAYLIGHIMIAVQEGDLSLDSLTTSLSSDFMTIAPLNSQAPHKSKILNHQSHNPQFSISNLTATCQKPKKTSAFRLLDFDATVNTIEKNINKNPDRNVSKGFYDTFVATILPYDFKATNSTFIDNEVKSHSVSERVYNKDSLLGNFLFGKSLEKQLFSFESTIHSQQSHKVNAQTEFI